MTDELVIVDNDGALFRCKPAVWPWWRYTPTEIWNIDQDCWVAYYEAGELKQIGWGDGELTLEEFEARRRELARRRSTPNRIAKAAGQRRRLTR